MSITLVVPVDDNPEHDLALVRANARITTSAELALGHIVRFSDYEEGDYIDLQIVHIAHMTSTLNPKEGPAPTTYVHCKRVPKNDNTLNDEEIMILRKNGFE